MHTPLACWNSSRLRARLRCAEVSPAGPRSAVVDRCGDDPDHTKYDRDDGRHAADANRLAVDEPNATAHDRNHSWKTEGVPEQADSGAEKGNERESVHSALAHGFSGIRHFDTRHAPDRREPNGRRARPRTGHAPFEPIARPSSDIVNVLWTSAVATEALAYAFRPKGPPSEHLTRISLQFPRAVDA